MNLLIIGVDEFVCDVALSASVVESDDEITASITTQKYTARLDKAYLTSFNVRLPDLFDLF